MRKSPDISSASTSHFSQNESGNLALCVEVIVGFIRHRCLFVFISRSAPGAWRYTPFCMQPLYALHFVHDSFTAMRCHLQEEPRNVIRFLGPNARHQFSRHEAPIFAFPSWSGKVPSRRFTGFSKQAGVGSLQFPSVDTVRSLANVDLFAFSDQVQNQRLAFRRPERLRSLRRLHASLGGGALCQQKDPSQYHAPPAFALGQFHVHSLPHWRL